MEMDPSGARLSERDAYHELQGYTLGLGDERFLHQHVVSVWESYSESHQAVADLLKLHGVI